MRVVQLSIANFRSIAEKIDITLGAVNVLIGANNSGKSTILRALYAMQSGLGNMGPDVRDGAEQWEVDITFDQISSKLNWALPNSHDAKLLLRGLKSGHVQRDFVYHTGDVLSASELPQSEPGHFIVPFLSKRKVNAFGQNSGENFSRMIVPSMENLPAKLQELSSRDYPGHEPYRIACSKVLGFIVDALPTAVGIGAGKYLPNGHKLWLEQMGDGVPNIVALLVYLVQSEGKLFLIEEPENDLHPIALKGLLDLIIASSTTNQFVVSTHSNIVLRHLGGTKDAKIIKIDANPNEWPISAKVQEIPRTPEARLEALKELGYSLEDFELWSGWLILEEASAERIIRDFLIPWFVPRLSRLRTLSTRGVDSVESSFDDFNRLIRYAHLEYVYRFNAWVLVDGDPRGQKVIARLKESYATWPPDRFKCLEQSNFEQYYPNEFGDRVAAVFASKDRSARREAKRDLLIDVLAWLDADEIRGKKALAVSAAKVIHILKDIESQMQ